MRSARARMEFTFQVAIFMYTSLPCAPCQATVKVSPVNDSDLTSRAPPFRSWSGEHSLHSILEKRLFLPICPCAKACKWKNPLFFPLRDTRWPRLAHHNLQSIVLSRAFFMNADKPPRAPNSPGALKATPPTLRTLWWVIISSSTLPPLTSLMPSNASYNANVTLTLFCVCSPVRLPNYFCGIKSAISRSISSRVWRNSS